MCEQLITFKIKTFSSSSTIYDLLHFSIPVIFIFSEIPTPNLKYPFSPAGLGYIFAIILYLRLKIKNKKTNLEKFRDSMLITGIITLACASPLFPWQFLQHCFSSLQYPWRLLFPAAAFLAFGCGLTLHFYITTLRSRAKWILLVFLMTAFSFFFNIFGYYSYMIYKNYFTDQHHLRTDNNGLYAPYTFKPHGEKLICSDSVIATYKRESKNIILNIQTAPDSSFIILPLIYYKGYVAESLKKEQLLPVVISANGCVQLNLFNAQGQYKVYFKGTPLLHFSKWITSISLLFTLVLLFLKRRKD